MTTTTQITEAISRSQSHNERVDVEFAGTREDLLVELDAHIDSDTQEIDSADENDGTVDVWAFDPQANDSSMIWRLCVTLVDAE